MKVDAKKIWACMERLRETRPLVHHITNYVTANDCANATLAIGASPVMADDPAEAAEMTSISSALVLNIGTLDARTVDAMLAAGRVANDRGIPVVFDPVGVGATTFRNETAARLMREIRFSVIRGNASEIAALSGGEARTKGVDAEDALAADVKKILREIAPLTESGAVCAVTGATDVVSDGRRAAAIENGHPAMTRITGTGCMCTSLVASLCGASVPPFEAAVCGVAIMGIAGEIAFERSGGGIGRMRTYLVDEIAAMSAKTFERRLRMTCEER